MGDVKGRRHVEGADTDGPTAGETDAVPEDREDGQHDHESEVAGHDEKPDWRNGHDLESLDLLIDLHGPELGGHRRTAPPDHDDGNQEGTQLAEQTEGDQVGDKGVGAEFAEFGGGLHGEDEADAEGDEAGHRQGLDPDSDHLPEGEAGERTRGLVNPQIR